MRKALIVLAVLGVTSGAAMAQSSVTLYGDADVGIGKAPSAGNTKWGLQASSIVTSNGQSRLGFIGKEDLGNGMWAGFNYEGDVHVDNGAGDGFARAAWVGLGSNTWGAFRLGQNYTVGFDAVMTYDLTHLAQYSVLADTFGFGGNPAPFGSGQVKYSSPTFGGVSAELSYVFKANGAVIDDGVSNQSDRWTANVVYDQGPIKAAATIDKPSHTQAGGNANKANWNLGGSYTFGQMFAVSASYSQTNNAHHWQGTPSVVFGARRYGWELGGSFFTGPFTVTLDLTRDTKNDLYGGRKYTNGVLEGKYNLSKRTYLYADYLRLDGDNNYGIGIDHMF